MRFKPGLRRALFGGLLAAAACNSLSVVPTAAPRTVTAPAAATTAAPATVTKAPPAPTQAPAFTATLPTPTPAAPATALAPFLAFPTTEGEVIALVGAAVIDGTGAPARANWTVLIQGGRILDAGPNLALPPDARVLELTGRTIIPGLFDLHAHLYA